MLIEVRYYSPTDYHIWHYGLIEAESFQKATDLMFQAGMSFRIGKEPLTFVKVQEPTTHLWGKGFSLTAGDLSRRLVKSSAEGTNKG
jgi:hypothetical protein